MIEKVDASFGEKINFIAGFSYHPYLQKIVNPYNEQYGNIRFEMTPQRSPLVFEVPAIVYEIQFNVLNEQQLYV